LDFVNFVFLGDCHPRWNGAVLLDVDEGSPDIAMSMPITRT
jgi:hypothetical protein